MALLCIQEFPPKEGDVLATSILQWSLEDGSFWRTPSMATCYDIGRVHRAFFMAAGRELSRDDSCGDGRGNGIARRNQTSGGELVMESCSRNSSP